MLVKEGNGIVENIYVKEIEGEPNDCCVRITRINGNEGWSDFENNKVSDKPKFKYKLAVCQQYVHIVMPMSSMTIEGLRGIEWAIIKSSGEILESGGLL